MTQENQNKLNALMLKFRALYDENNRISFEKEWKPFIKSLSNADKEIAEDIWFRAVLENMEAMQIEMRGFSKNLNRA